MFTGRGAWEENNLQRFSGKQIKNLTSIDRFSPLFVVFSQKFIDFIQKKT